MTIFEVSCPEQMNLLSTSYSSFPNNGEVWHNSSQLSERVTIWSEIAKINKTEVKKLKSKSTEMGQMHYYLEHKCPNKTVKKSLLKTEMQICILWKKSVSLKGHKSTFLHKYLKKSNKSLLVVNQKSVSEKFYFGYALWPNVALFFSA